MGTGSGSLKEEFGSELLTINPRKDGVLYRLINKWNGLKEDIRHYFFDRGY